jgi:hypothetical protein
MVSETRSEQILLLERRKLSKKEKGVSRVENSRPQVTISSSKRWVILR